MHLVGERSMVDRVATVAHAPCLHGQFVSRHADGWDLDWAGLFIVGLPCHVMIFKGDGKQKEGRSKCSSVRNKNTHTDSKH